MSLLESLIERIRADRLAQTALDLVRIPSPTGKTREAAGYFAEVYRKLGCEVTILTDIPNAPGGSDAPSVAAWFRGAGTGPTLQFDGHTDTIATPHPDPPDVRDGVLTGRGAADMKGGVAAAMEAVRVLKDAGITLPGDLLLTTHGLHEAPIGHGEGLEALIARGLHGDAAVVVEGPCDELAVAGRGMAIFNITVRGPETSTHENETPVDTPHPLFATGDLLIALERERLRLRAVERPYVGAETLFIGQVHGGDFYNRFPTACHLQGTRRYFADHSFSEVQNEFEAILDRVARRTGTKISVQWDRIRDGYEVSSEERIVQAFQKAYRALNGVEVPLGGFRSVADVSIFVQNAGTPAIFCGNRGAGAHADREVVPIGELVRQTKHLLGIIVYYYGLQG